MPTENITESASDELPLFKEDCEVASSSSPQADVARATGEQTQAMHLPIREVGDADLSREVEAAREVTVRPISSAVDEIQLVDPVHCEPFLGAPRAGTGYLDSRDGDLAENVKENGVVEPIVVWLDGSKFRILSGNRRLAVVVHLREQGHPIRLPARQFMGDAVAAMAFAHACNEGREKPTAMEQAKAVAWALANLGQPQAEIGRVLGFNEAKVSRLLTLANLPAFILDVATDPNSLSENFAALLQSHLGDQKKLELMNIRAEKLRGRNQTMAGPKLARYLLTGTDEADVQEIADGDGKVIARLSSDRHGAILLKMTPAYLPADADWQGMLTHVVGEIKLRMERQRGQQC